MIHCDKQYKIFYVDFLSFSCERVRFPTSTEHGRLVGYITLNYLDKRSAELPFKILQFCFKKPFLRKFCNLNIRGGFVEKKK